MKDKYRYLIIFLVIFILFLFFSSLSSEQRVVYTQKAGYKNLVEDVIPRGDVNDDIFWDATRKITPSPEWTKVKDYNMKDFYAVKTPIGDYGSPRTKASFKNLYARKLVNIKTLENRIYTLRIASDEGADVFINGEKVLSMVGDEHLFDYWNYEIEVTPYLKQGINIIAIHVLNNKGNCYFDAELDYEISK